MIGVGLDISKPMYNVGTINKMDLLPPRLSNLPLPKMSTKHVLKHRVMSPTRASLRSQVPAVGGAVLLGVGIAGMASNKAREVVAHAISTTGTIEGVAAVFVARGFLGNISRACAVLFDQRFSVGDIIQVEKFKGRVVEMGIKTISLDTADNHRIVVPTFWFHGKDILNISRAPWHAIALKIHVEIDDSEKIPKIVEEITDKMKSNPGVYLEEEEPYCHLSGVEASCIELSYGCKLKQASEDELSDAERHVMLNAVRVIKDNGAALGEPMRKRY